MNSFINSAIKLNPLDISAVTIEYSRDIADIMQANYPPAPPTGPPPPATMQAPPPYPIEKISVVVDKNKFIATRNALTNAFVGLSGAIDTAVKAYVAHTNAVLDEGSTLDVGYLMQPLMNLNQVAQIAQQAILQNGTAPNSQLNPDGTKKKRQYKPRDPNAPKRPLTAYFRFLQEQRPKIAAELNARGPNAEGGKAGDISKLATERWNAMTPQLQAPYRAAYQNEMKAYNDAVKVYKAEGGQVEDEDAAAEDDDEVTASAPQAVVAGADPEEDDDDSSSEDSSSEEEDEEEEAPAPPPPAKPAKVESPAAAKKTPKSGPKKIKAGADPVEPEPTPAPASSKKRKEPASASEADGGKKKRGRPTKAEQAAKEPVAETPQPESTPATEKKKDKKKKRKSEGA